MGALRAARYLISGRVQGVGFRHFAQRSALKVGVTGWARNLDDGRVEVQAAGTPAQLDDLEHRLRKGPQGADVRSVEASEIPMLELSGFQIRY